MPPPVITITRQYAAGGSDVARLVAAALDWTVIDNEFVDEVALRAGLAPEEVAERDERAPGLLERLASTLRSGCRPKGRRSSSWRRRAGENGAEGRGPVGGVDGGSGAGMLARSGAGARAAAGGDPVRPVWRRDLRAGGDQRRLRLADAGHRSLAHRARSGLGRTDPRHSRRDGRASRGNRVGGRRHHSARRS